MLFRSGNFYSYPFESLAFCAGTPGNLAGFSQFNFPVSQWATDLKINATQSWTFKIGLFAFNNYWISNNYYLRIDNPGGTSGAVIPVEIDWSPKLRIFGKDLPGNWNFTAWGNTNNRETTGAAKSFLGSTPGVAPGLVGPPPVYRGLRLRRQYLATGYGSRSDSSQDRVDAFWIDYLDRSPHLSPKLPAVRRGLLLGALVQAPVRLLRYGIRL